MRELKGLGVIGLIALAAYFFFAAHSSNDYTSVYNCVTSTPIKIGNYTMSCDVVSFYGAQLALIVGCLAGAAWLIWNMRRSNQGQDRPPPSP